MSFHSCLTCDTECSKRTLKALFCGCDRWSRVICEIECDDEMLYAMAAGINRQRAIEELRNDLNEIESRS